MPKLSVRRLSERPIAVCILDRNELSVLRVRHFFNVAALIDECLRARGVCDCTTADKDCKGKHYRADDDESSYSTFPLLLFRWFLSFLHNFTLFRS